MPDDRNTDELDVDDQQNGEAVADDDSEAPAAISDGVIMFVAKWAPAAQALRKALQESAADIVYIDVDDQPAFADRYVVRSLPTVVQLRAGRETGRIVGSVKPSTVRALC